MNNSKIMVWDPLVRIFHWLLVLSFAVAWLTEDDWMSLHSQAGYLLSFLLLIRLIWGVIGSRYARFSDFVKPPRQVIAYLKDMLAFRAHRYVGHNPAGGAMIVVLMTCLAMAALSGIAVYGMEGAGPMAEWMLQANAFEHEFVEEIHEFFANASMLLVLLHIAGVVVGSLMHDENLPKSMLTGKKHR